MDTQTKKHLSKIITTRDNVEPIMEDLRRIQIKIQEDEPITDEEEQLVEWAMETDTQHALMKHPVTGEIEEYPIKSRKNRTLTWERYVRLNRKRNGKG